MVKAASRLGVAALLLSLLAAEPAAAQVPDLIDLSGQYMPGTRVPEAPPTKVQVASYDATVNAPIPLGEETFLIPGVSYHVDAVSFADPAPELVELRAFHGLEMALLFVQLLPSDWSLSARVAPGLAGDFTGFDSGLFRINGLLMATHSFNDSFVLGGGGLASYAFGSFLPLPALYLDWKPHKKLRLETFLPAFLTFRVLPYERIELGLRAEFAGNAYGVRDERVRGRWPCVAEDEDVLATSFDETQAQPSQCLDNFAYSVGSVGSTLSVRLFETVWWNVYAAHTFFRRFEPNNRDGGVVGEVQSLPQTFLIRSGLTLRVPAF